MSFVDPKNPLAKGPVTYCLDEISKKENCRELMTELAQAIDALEGNNYAGLENVFANHLFPHVIGDKEKISKITAYLNKYWFDKTSKQVEFRNNQPIAPVYAQGVRQTLKLGLEHNRKIDSWWIVDYPKVLLLNMVSAQQVTLLIMTPRPKKVVPGGVWTSEVESRSGAWVTVTHVDKESETRITGTREVENDTTAPK